MSNGISLRIPKSLYEDIKEMAKEEGVSMNQFITLTLSEKVAYMKAWNHFQEQAKRGSREEFLAVLDKVPKVEPPEYDRFDYDQLELQPQNAKILAENSEEKYDVNDSK